MSLKRSKTGADNSETTPQVVETYVARKLHRTFASRFGTGIGIGTSWKLAESRFQNIEETDKNGSTDVLRSKLREILGRPSLEHIVDVNSETTPQVVKTKSKLNQENNDPLPKLTETSASVATTRRGPVTRVMSLKRSKTGADNSETTPQVVETKSKLNQENNDPLPKPTETSASRRRIKNGSTDVLRSKLREILGRPSLEHIVDVNSETTPQVVKTKSKLNQENNDPLPKLYRNFSFGCNYQKGASN
ncbi:hypothetical protein YC2023_093750 [Brassica napus]